ACANVRHATPTRMGDGESPATLPNGMASFHMGLGKNYRDSEDGTPQERVIKLGAAAGLGHSFDLRGSVGFLQSAESSSNEYAAPSMSMATRIKWNPEFIKHFFAVSAGVGFGISDMSGVGEAWLYSIECAQIVGFENRYFVP